VLHIFNPTGDLTELHHSLPDRTPMTLTISETRRPEKDNSRSPAPLSSHTVPTWALSSRLQPTERAAFTVTSRLLASIVTESLLHAFYVPISSEEACGVCIILSTHVMGEHPILTRALRPEDVFAILPLHQEPVFSGGLTRHGRPIWLLDPLDMIPSIFELSSKEGGLVEYVRFHLLRSWFRLFTHLYQRDLQNAILSCLVPPPWQLEDSVALALNQDPLHWWKKIAANVMMGRDIYTDLAEELSSSYMWQSTVFSRRSAERFNGPHVILFFFRGGIRGPTGLSNIVLLDY